MRLLPVLIFILLACPGFAEDDPCKDSLNPSHSNSMMDPLAREGLAFLEQYNMTIEDLRNLDSVEIRAFMQMGISTNGILASLEVAIASGELSETRAPRASTAIEPENPSSPDTFEPDPSEIPLRIESSGVDEWTTPRAAELASIMEKELERIQKQSKSMKIPSSLSLSVHGFNDRVTAYFDNQVLIHRSIGMSKPDGEVVAVHELIHAVLEASWGPQGTDQKSARYFARRAAEEFLCDTYVMIFHPEKGKEVFAKSKGLEFISDFNYMSVADFTDDRLKAEGALNSYSVPGGFHLDADIALGPHRAFLPTKILAYQHYIKTLAPDERMAFFDLLVVTMKDLFIDERPGVAEMTGRQLNKHFWQELIKRMM